MIDLLTLNDLSKKEIIKLVKLGRKVKKHPGNYSTKLIDYSLLMLFEKPSLRTHLSFDIGMYQLGGYAVFYDLSRSTLGKKESMKDFAKVVSRYADIIMARLYDHQQLLELAKHSAVPVINGLTDLHHPCQALGDFLTIAEKFRRWKKATITYLGDANNNVTHSLIVGCNKIGIDIKISCPNKKEFLPNRSAIGDAKYRYIENPKKAVKETDIIYTDTWMSYHIPESQEKQRAKTLEKYRVNKSLFDINKEAYFMHCLPAKRGQEVTDEVLDSPRSIVYDQAENRMHIQKAILLKLLL